MSSTPDIGELSSEFSCNFETGELYRKRKAGLEKQVTSLSSNGYARVGFQSKRYGAHRVVWALANGVWPSMDIDHINGNRQDNRICNLRHVDRSTNLENTKAAKSHNKSSGVLGVYVDKKRGVIYSRIRVKKVDVHLGYFKTISAAAEAYLFAKTKFHKGYAP